jgi:hypothetical protein
MTNAPITARLYLASKGDPADGIMDVDFQTVPRVGERVILELKEGNETYMVKGVDHYSPGKDPARVALAVEPV